MYSKIVEELAENVENLSEKEKAKVIENISRLASGGKTDAKQQAYEVLESSMSKFVSIPEYKDLSSDQTRLMLKVHQEFTRYLEDISGTLSSSSYEALFSIAYQATMKSSRKIPTISSVLQSAVNIRELMDLKFPGYKVCKKK